MVIPEHIAHLVGDFLQQVVEDFARWRLECATSRNQRQLLRAAFRSSRWRASVPAMRSSTRCSLAFAAGRQCVCGRFPAQLASVPEAHLCASGRTGRSGCLCRVRRLRRHQAQIDWSDQQPRRQVGTPEVHRAEQGRMNDQRQHSLIARRVRNASGRFLRHQHFFRACRWCWSG